jgi:DNA-binding transcriptional MerR regulator
MSTNHCSVSGKRSFRNSIRRRGGIRQYRKEDIETVKLIYHLVKERGMTLPGARQRMKDNKEATIRNFEIVDRLRAIREELVGMKLALDEFTYEDVESLKENIQGLK